MKKIKTSRTLLRGMIESRTLWNRRPKRYSLRADWAEFYEYCLSDM